MIITARSFPSVVKMVPAAAPFSVRNRLVPTGIKVLASMLRRPEALLQELERLLPELDLIAFTEQGRDVTTAGSRKVRAAKVISFPPRAAA